MAACGARSSSARLSIGVRPGSHATSSVWWNSPTCTRAPSRQLPVVLDGGVAAEQPQEVRLAAAVGAEHRHPIAGVDLDVERLGEPDELEPLDLQHALAGAGAGEVHAHGSLGRRGAGGGPALTKRSHRDSAALARAALPSLTDARCFMSL